MSPEQAIAAIEAIQAEPGFSTNGGESSQAKQLIESLPGLAFMPPLGMEIRRVDPDGIAVEFWRPDIYSPRRLIFSATGYSAFDVLASPDPDTVPAEVWAWGQLGRFFIGDGREFARLNTLILWVLDKPGEAP